MEEEEEKEEEKEEEVEEEVEEGGVHRQCLSHCLSPPWPEQRRAWLTHLAQEILKLRKTQKEMCR